MYFGLITLIFSLPSFASQEDPVSLEPCLSILWHSILEGRGWYCLHERPAVYIRVEILPRLQRLPGTETAIPRNKTFFFKEIFVL